MNLGSDYMNSIPLYKQNMINSSRNSTPSKFGNYLTFLIPILNLFTINLVGELLIGELLLILLLPALVYKRKTIITNKNLLVIIVFLLLWLSNQVITDLIQSTSARDFLRGWAGISFFLLLILSLSLLLKTPLRIMLFLVGLSITSLIRPFEILPNEDFSVLWKFGVGSSTLLILCLPFLWRIFKYPKNLNPLKYIILIHFFMGIFSFFMNARSFAGITVLTGVLLYFFYTRKRIFVSKTKVIIFVFIGFILSIGLLNIYSEGAKSGLFGVKAKEKYEMQIGNNNLGALGVLIAGRSEILVSSIAISDSPIIGHGSWAKDRKYTLLYQRLRAKLKDESLKNTAISRSNLIPSHSYIFGAWVFAGIFGAIFWIVILYYLIFKIFPQAFYKVSPLSILFFMSFLSFFWNIFFSPFGSYVRIEVAFYIVVFLLIINNQNQTYKKGNINE